MARLKSPNRFLVEHAEHLSTLTQDHPDARLEGTIGIQHM
jgi:hypothetical protein